MIDYAHITTLPSLAKIRKNPRQWDFFCWLLNQADEDGYAEVSVREFAASTGIAKSTLQSWLISATFRPLLEVTKYSGRTLVFFCNYASYTNNAGNNITESRPLFGHFSATVRPSGRNLKEKFPPAPPIKENNVGCKVATLQEQQQQAAGANFSSSALEEVATPKPQPQPRTAKQVEDARSRFWAQCCDVHNHHRDWPAEAVKSFFLFWTQWNQQEKKFKFELEDSWGTGYRMQWYIKRGHWLDQVQEAKLEQVKNGGGRSSGVGRKSGTPTTAEIKQKELALAIEQEEHDRRAQAAITMMQNAKSHEDAKSDYRYWEGLGLDNPATLAMAQEKPEWLAAYNLAVQKRNEKKSQ